MPPGPLRLSVLVTLSLGAGLAGAGEQLTPSMLAQQADSAVLVTVSLSGPQPEITVDEWLFGSPQPVRADWIGLCLPGRALLLDWQARYGNFPGSQVLWRQALAEGSYRAVAVLRERAGRSSPFCETETLLAEHWVAHPGHAAWRAAFEGVLETRRPPPTTGRAPPCNMISPGN